jgi:hypothetical protein
MIVSAGTDRFDNDCVAPVAGLANVAVQVLPPVGVIAVSWPLLSAPARTSAASFINSRLSGVLKKLFVSYV